MGCIGSKAVAAITTSKESTTAPIKAVSVRHENESVSTSSTNRATNLSRSRMQHASKDRMSDSIMSLGVVHLSDNSHHSEDGYRYKMECTVTLPLCDHFDEKELTRKFDKHFIKHAHNNRTRE